MWPQESLALLTLAEVRQDSAGSSTVSSSSLGTQEPLCHSRVFPHTLLYLEAGATAVFTLYQFFLLKKKKKKKQLSRGTSFFLWMEGHIMGATNSIIPSHKGNS